MTKPNNDNSEEVNYLLTHRRGYLERLLADIEAGQFQLDESESIDLERSPSGQVWVPENVLAGLGQIRQEGQVNMADRDEVVREAERLELHETASWVTANPVTFMSAIIYGAEAKPAEGDSE